MEYYLNAHDWVFAIDKQGNKWQYNWKEKKLFLRFILAHIGAVAQKNMQTTE